MTGAVNLLRARVREQIEHLGGIAQLAGECLRRLFTGRFETRLFLRDLDYIGWQSTGVILLLGSFTGMVLVVQTGLTLKRWGADVYASDIVALTLVRELGPVLAGFLVAGRVGSGIAAEIGAMATSEQIDAMRSLGANPLRKLVIPKAVAALFGLPLLTAITDLIGILGGMLMAFLLLHITPYQFINRVQERVTIGDLLSGIGKTAAFGLIIALVACYYGLRTTGGTAGVGRSATSSVVTSCVLILATNLFITSAFFAIGGVLQV